MSPGDGDGDGAGEGLVVGGGVRRTPAKVAGPRAISPSSIVGTADGAAILSARRFMHVPVGRLNSVQFHRVRSSLAPLSRR